MSSEAPRAAPLSGIVAVERASPDCSTDLRLSLALAGRMLADLGAEVIVAEPPAGDALRRIGPVVGGVGATFAFLSAGKRLLRPSSETGEAALIAGADVLLRDPVPPPAAPTRVEAIASFLPDGGEGDDAPESAFTVAARTGLLDLVGDPARAPLALGGQQLAYGVGLALYTGCVAALAGDGGARETVRANFLDVGAWLNWKGVIAPSWGGASPSRQGEDAEWRVVRCADGWVALVHRQDEWPGVKALCGDPRLDDPRFARREDRRRHAAEVSRIVEDRLLTLTRAEVRELALAARLPFGPVWSVEELIDDPQYRARGFLHPVRLPDGGAAVMPRSPVTWGDAAFAPGPIPDEARA